MPAILSDLQAAVSASFRIPAPVDPKGDVGLTNAEAIQLRKWEKEKGEYSARRARAAMALVRLGYASEVWHLLEHSSIADDRSHRGCSQRPGR